ncbi:MAG: acetylglutamate kinase [Campylobacterales bacterium]|nr:acetylglutamate kinase [Campylobacterales bacterium]
MQHKIQTAKTLLEALPFIQKFNGSKIVIKYGGSAQINPELKKMFARDILLLQLVGIKPVVVHGGGKRINELLAQLNIKTDFIDGSRVTTYEAIKIVEMVLSGEINKEIVSLLNQFDAKAIGISGKDANCIKAVPKEGGKYGYTGYIDHVNPDVINNLIRENFIPVIAPIASSYDDDHPGFNINADLMACKVASAIGARKILFLTDTAGVLDKDKKLIHSLSFDDVEKFKKDGTISGGMIPKVDACIEAIKKGVKKAHIIDGRVEHSLLLELFTSEGIGTQILEKS